MMWWYDGGPGWGGWLVMSLMMLAFWGLIAAGAVALWRGTRHEAPPPHDRGDDALRLLDERFARGEIDEDDYTRRRDLLRSGR